jgi:DNA-binding MarR family transcriptional regulator
MKVTQRHDQTISSVTKHKEKIVDVLTWCLHWGQSTLPQLARSAKISEKNAYRFLADLESKKLIQVCKNTHTHSIRLYRVTQKGIAYLKEWHIETDKPCSKAKVQNNTRIIHDLEAQNLAQDFIMQHGCDEIIAARNITIPMRVRCDFLARSRAGFWASVEWDRTPKSTAEFFERLTSAYEEIENGMYQAVFVYSTSTDVIARYRRLFETEPWPIYRKNDKRNLIKLESTLYPDTNIKRLFNFVVFKGGIENPGTEKTLKIGKKKEQ